MQERDKQRVIKVAHIFREHKSEILLSWLELLRKNAIAKDEIEVRYFQHGFETLVNDFITHLTAGDFKTYYAGNNRIAHEIAYNDISYRKFIEAFHLFEESYGQILIHRLNTTDLGPYLGAVDQLHHNTIAIVAEAYFDVKDVTVFSLAKLAELRDPETAYHLERTREYSVLLSQALRLEEDFLALIYRVGPLHDIGKVGIRDSILLKPTRLTEAEYEEMKMHPVWAGRTIDAIIGTQKVGRGYLHMAKEICLYHHERYDGQGYPAGLQGEGIPLSARIFALADAYDAIVSKRPYKPALSHETAVDRIQQDSGRHFDPTIVRGFLEVCYKFKEIHNRYQEE